MIGVREYLDVNGRSPFGRWFDQLDRTAAAKTVVALTRITLGNFSNVKSLGGGVLECRIDYGPGYRIYFGREDDAIVILLGGGSKKRQSNDIQDAKARWKNYKERKLKGK